MEVRAIRQGYHGSRIREPGDVFDVAEGELGKWMEPIHPLDHDADGKKGGSKPAGDSQPSARDVLKNEAIALGLEFAANIPTAKLQELVEAKQAEVAAAASKPAGDAMTDEDKILKALELSGRTDEMTVTEAEAIIAAAGTASTDI